MFGIFRSVQDRKREKRRAYRQRRQERKRQNFRQTLGRNNNFNASASSYRQTYPPTPRSLTNAYRFVSRPWSRPASFATSSHDQITDQHFEDECQTRLNEMYVMPRTTISEILQRYRSDSTASSSDEECLVIDTDVRVSLLCPLTRKRIRDAALFFNCQHVQCFDALAFMKTYRHRIDLTVKCPICSKRYVFNRASLWKSVFLQEILEHPGTANVSEVRIKPDETWQVVEDNPVVCEV